MKLSRWMGVVLLCMGLLGCGGGGGNPQSVPVAEEVPPVALYTTAPFSMTLDAGSSQQFVIAGGKPPYLAVSSNVSVVVSGVKDTQLTVGGLAAGSAMVVVRDAAGTSVPVNVTVGDAAVQALFTSAPASVVVAVGATPVYSVLGGAAPYTATSSNASVVSVSLVGGNLAVTGIQTGLAQIVIRDGAGASVTVEVSVGSVRLAVTPGGAEAIINDVLRSTITGGKQPFTASAANELVADAVVENGNQLKITLKQGGETIVTVLGADNKSVPFSLTSNAATPGIRLSPNAVTVSEFEVEPIFFTVFGAATGAINVFSSDITRLSAAIRGNVITVSTGSSGSRCVPRDTPVIITVVDDTRAIGVAVVTLEDNRDACP